MKTRPRNGSCRINKLKDDEKKAGMSGQSDVDKVKERNHSLSGNAAAKVYEGKSLETSGSGMLAKVSLTGSLNR